MPHMAASLTAPLGSPDRRRGRAGTIPAMPNGAHAGESSPYVELDRDAWAALGTEVDQPLTTEEITRLRGLGEQLDLDEVQQVYLPISRLLSLRVKAARR